MTHDSLYNWHHSLRQFLLGYLLLSPLPSLAATDWIIEGEVLEKGTRQPLAGANVFVLDQDELIAISDARGHFQLPLKQPGRYTLSAVALGHDKASPLDISIDVQHPIQHITFYLNSNTTLPAVVIKAPRLSDRVGKTSLSGMELERIAGSAGDPLRALQALPGVVVNNDLTSAPAIRGSRPGDNLYYADFLPVPYLFHIGGVVSVFPADLIDDFNLFASAFGPEYGDGIGAAIDVSLRPPRRDRLGGKFNLSLIGADFLVEGPLADNQSLLFSARRSYLDLVIDEVKDEKEGETIDVPRYYDYLGKYRWKINTGNRLSFYLTGAGDKLGTTIDAGSDTAIKQPLLAGHSRSDKAYHNQALIWDRRLGKRRSNKLALGYNQNRNDSIVGTAATQKIQFESFYLREQLRLRPTANHELTLGGMAQQMSVSLHIDSVNPLCSDLEPDCDISSAPRSQLDDRFQVAAVNAYLKDRWRARPSLHLIGGLHYSYEDYLHKAYLEPRLGLEWQLSEDTLFTAGWGEHNQFPEGGKVVQTFGNPELAHLRSRHSVLGLSHNIGEDWLIKGELYHKRFDDLVVSDASSNYINGATGNAYGMELLLKREASAPLSGWLALSASKAERRIESSGDSFPFNYDQPLAATLVLNYRQSPRWSYGLTWRYHTGAPYTPVIGTYTVTDPDGSSRLRPLYGDTNSERLPAYHRLDLRVDRDFVYDRFLLDTYMEIGNVYNRKNIAGYRYPPDYDPSKKTTRLQLPLIISFGVMVTF